MRFALSLLLGVAVGLPAMAQRPGGGGGGFPGGPGGGGFGRGGGGVAPAQDDREVQRLKEAIKELEAKLKAQADGKKDGATLEFVIVGDKKEEKKPEPRKDEPKREEPRRPEGAGNPFNPMGGFGGVGGFGSGFGGVARGNPPGFDKLTEDEQKTFRRLMEKMAATPPQPREGDRRPEGGRPAAGGERREGEPRPTAGNVEERLKKLEAAIDDLAKAVKAQQQSPRGGGR